MDHRRKVRPRTGITIEHRVDLGQNVLWNLGPPRIRYEDATIDVALSASNDMGAIAVLASACGGRRTTASRLAATVPRRAWIGAVLRDVAEGTCSVLEHGYLDRSSVRTDSPVHGASCVQLVPAARSTATPSCRV